MAKRYYICRIIGDGTYENPRNSELRKYVRETWDIRHLKQVVAWGFCNWGLMKYDLTQAQHDEVMANVPQLFSFPQGALDRTVGSLPVATRNTIGNKMENIGLNTGWITGGTTIRQVLKYIARTFELANWGEVPIAAGNFDLDTTVAQITARFGVEARSKIQAKVQSLGVDTSGFTASTTVREIVRAVRYESDGVTPRLFGTIKRARWFFNEDDDE